MRVSNSDSIYTGMSDSQHMAVRTYTEALQRIFVRQFINRQFASLFLSPFVEWLFGDISSERILSIPNLSDWESISDFFRSCSVLITIVFCEMQTINFNAMPGFIVPKAFVSYGDSATV